MDAAARRSLVAAVRSLTERGSAVVVATHDSDLASEMADRTIALGEGRAVEVGGSASASAPAAPSDAPARSSARSPAGARR
jgi:energy-coupling factor transport system ATP-binding protein